MQNKIKNFVFVGYDFDDISSVATLKYALDDKYFFEEKITFHNAKTCFSAEEKQAVNNILFYLHLACGISYYKTFCPKNIVINTGELTKDQAMFFDEFYINGLGEFAFKNNIILNDVIKFPYNDITPNNASYIVLPEIVAVPIGGGKDSIVVLESLINAGINVVCIAQGRPKPIKETIEVSGCKDISFTRKICPNLIALNGQDGVLNGHIPITGVYAFCLTLCAILYGYDKVAMGNERSANVGNLVRDDNMEINHQWSKSIEFERMFSDFNKKYMLKNFDYFSMLRPLAE